MVLRGEITIVITKEKIVIIDSPEEPFDYTKILDYARFEPPAELSLPAYAYEQIEDF